MAFTCILSNLKIKIKQTTKQKTNNLDENSVGVLVRACPHLQDYSNKVVCGQNGCPFLHRRSS